MIARPVIEQVKAVLVAPQGDSPQQAFEELRFASPMHNVKLNVLAAGLNQAARGTHVTDSAVEAALIAEWGVALTRYHAGEPPRSRRRRRGSGQTVCRRRQQRQASG